MQAAQSALCSGPACGQLLPAASLYLEPMGPPDDMCWAQLEPSGHAHCPPWGLSAPIVHQLVPGDTKPSETLRRHRVRTQ